MFNNIIFKSAFGALVITFFFNYLGEHGLYSPATEYDSWVHFLGGLTVSLGILWFYFHSGFFNPTNRKYKNFFFIAIVGFLFIGFTWESFELLGGIMKVDMPGYIYDTALDLTVGILGTIVGCIYTFNQERKWQS